MGLMTMDLCLSGVVGWGRVGLGEMREGLLSNEQAQGVTKTTVNCTTMHARDLYTLWHH